MGLSISPVGLQIRSKSVQLGGHPIELGGGFFALCSHSVQLGGHPIELGCGFFGPGSNCIELGCGNIALCRNDIELVFQTIHPSVQPRLHSVDLFREHLMAFDDKVQFVLEIFGLDSDLMAEISLYFFFKVKNDLFETFKIFTIHLITSGLNGGTAPLLFYYP